MIPTASILTNEITEITHPNRTYKINFYSDLLKANRKSFGLINDNELTILPENTLSGFTITDDGTVSISYNTTLAGYNLTQDDEGVLNLTLSTSLENMDRISGYIDGLEAVIQTIYLILSIERYKYVIYSWDYGVELLDLIGKPMPYVMSELPRRIKDALIQDNRIDDVIDFEFEVNRNKLHTTFTVITNLGNISAELEVPV